jgi:Ca-activated chloride channel family protein
MNNQEPGGLFVNVPNGGRVPLKGVAIEVKAAGVAAKVCVSQRYHNTEKVPVEAVYSFPLDESCAVCGFEVEIGGKRIVGKVEEREKAFEKYDDAMSQGHGAFLVDQDRPNIFTASVGNLLADQEAIVRLTYVTELEQSGDAIRLLIPTTISPRYLPQSTLAKIDPAELDHIAPPTVIGGVPYGLKLSVELEAASDVREVNCPSHPARVSLSGRKVNVELMGENIQLDQDFVLNVALAKPHEASALVSRDGDGVRAVMLNLFPDLSGFRRGPAEFIFIIDRSGSMQGSSIEQARTALLVALRSLESGDRFNVIGFGGRYETLFKESVPYSQQTLDEATKKVSTLQADLGGTELLAPLQFALETSKSESSRMIILLTDGEVGNEGECLELAKKHAANARIFTFGVGNGVSEFLLKGLARSSNAQAEFIHPNERIEPKVLRQINRIASASINNVRIDWGNLKTDLVAPTELPQLFNGDRFTVYARVVGGSSGKVTVLADSPSGPLKFPVEVDLERVVADGAIPVLMARKGIQELEEGRGAARGSAQTNRKENVARTRILELALRYQLISSATSFVAIEERLAQTTTQQAELRRIPVAMTKGWHGMREAAAPGGGGAVLYSMSPSARMKAPAAMSRVQRAAAAPDDMVMGKCESKKSDAGAGLIGSIKQAFGLGRAQPAPEPAAPQQGDHSEMLQQLELPQGFRPKSGKAGNSKEYDDLLKLTLAQKADGSFEATKEFGEAIGYSREKLVKARQALSIDAELALKVVATLAALEVFETQYAKRKDEWKLIAEKAERWLKAQKVPVPGSFADLRAWFRAEMGK